jgi:hypothetical protein
MYPVKVYGYSVEKDGNSTAPFLEMLYSHFANTLGNFWEVDGNVTITDPSKAFTIKPRNQGYDFQINFRRWDSDASLVTTTIDPLSEITNAGEASQDRSLPKSASNLAFKASSAFYFANADYVGDGLWVIELEDALFILNVYSEGKSYYGLHLGKILAPSRSSYISNGLDGLGILGNYIGLFIRGDSFSENNAAVVSLQSFSVEDYRICKTSNNPDFLASALQMHNGDGRDYTRVGIKDHSTTRERLEPNWVSISGSNNSLHRRPVGYLKYLHSFFKHLKSGTLLKTSSIDQEFLVNSVSTSTKSSHGVAIPWEIGKLPL